MDLVVMGCVSSFLEYHDKKVVRLVCVLVVVVVDCTRRCNDALFRQHRCRAMMMVAVRVEEEEEEAIMIVEVMVYSCCSFIIALDVMMRVFPFSSILAGL